MTEGLARFGVRPGYRIVLYFLVGLAALDALVAANRSTWRAYDPDPYRIKPHECVRRARDLVLVGGSPVSEGIDPAALVGAPWHGRPLEDVFNLGLPGATTSEVWHAIRHGIGIPPRVLVYGITASDLNESRNEPHGPEALMNVADVAEWLRLRPKAAAWCLRHYARAKLERCWNLYHYRNAIRLWAAERTAAAGPGFFPEGVRTAREGLLYTADLTRGNGFAPLQGFREGNLARMKAAGGAPHSFGFLAKYALGGHLHYLDRILDWGRDNGVSIILLDMPVSADLDEVIYPREFAAYRAALAEVERRRGATVLRPTRRAVGLTDDDFADLIHLNAAGTARFSYWLRVALTDPLAQR
jgi:hypothetical protein